MTSPRFPQLDRLSDYRAEGKGNGWQWQRNMRHRPQSHHRLPVDRLITEDGRVPKGENETLEDT